MNSQQFGPRGIPERKYVLPMQRQNEKVRLCGIDLDERLEGLGMFLLEACINHSCQPNVKLWPDAEKPLITAKATRDIGEGEEVFINYVDTKLERAERQEKLLSQYHFTCTCPRCEREK